MLCSGDSLHCLEGKAYVLHPYMALRVNSGRCVSDRIRFVRFQGPDHSQCSFVAQQVRIAGCFEKCSIRHRFVPDPGRSTRQNQDEVGYRDGRMDHPAASRVWNLYRQEMDLLVFGACCIDEVRSKDTDLGLGH